MGTGYGVYAQGVSGARPLLEVLSHNAIYDVNVAYRDWDGTSEALITAVADLMGLPFASNNFEGTCAFDPDFHLLAGSPCIDRGTPEEAPDHDLDGDPRPQGAAVDVGADEAQ